MRKKLSRRRNCEHHSVKGAITKKMLTKANIEHEKSKAGSPFFRAALSPTNEEQHLLFTLKNLGKLPEWFEGQLLVPLLNHPNPKIRCLAIKNVGKLRDENLLDKLSTFAKTEKNTLARREAISAIGRMKSEKAISILAESLADVDPKVALQALRGLLYFKEKPEVQTALDSLREHPNELIREHFANEVKNKSARLQKRKKIRIIRLAQML